MSLINKRDKKGITLAFALVIAGAGAILIMSIVSTLQQGRNQSNTFDVMNYTYRAAETGLNQAVGQLVIDPKIYDPSHPESLSGEEVEMADGKTQFSNVAELKDTSIGTAYYIVTTATRTVGKRKYVSRLHSIVRISNAGEYFWAVKDVLMLSAGVDADEGRVYAPELHFLNPNPAKPTTVLSAEYVDFVYPPPGSPFYDPGGEIQISSPSSGAEMWEPHELLNPIIFPQVTEGDMERYKKFALMPEGDVDLSDNHQVCDFTTWGDIFPPGYHDGGSPHGDDYYANSTTKHTTENKQHVYYCPESAGPMKIKGKIWGQVLFVSEGDIEIVGDIISDSNSDSYMPGSPEASSSTAHQAILITRGDVVITNDFYTWDPVTAGTKVEEIEALIMAPHGELYCEGYTNPLISPLLGITIHGSVLLESVMSGFDIDANKYNSPSIFASGSRTYKYMISLRDNPPPLLPALAKIYYSFEETVFVGKFE